MSTHEGTSAPEDAPREPEADAPPAQGEGPDEPAVEPAAGAEPDATEPIDLETLKADAALAAELADRIKRVEAEFMNETKRLRRQEGERQKYAIEGVVIDLLPVLDALYSAQKELDEGDAAREGLDLVAKQLASVLARHGVTPIDALGQPFDPGRHQAMMMVDKPDAEPQTVCEVMRPGYELHGRVVRAAEVLVVKPPPNEAPAEEEGGAAGEDD